MRKRYSDWLLIFLLASGVYLWQRTVFPFYTVDLFPDQLGAYFWKTGQPQWMYTTEARFDEWQAHSLPVARSLGLECGLSRFMYPPFVAVALSPFAEVPADYWRWSLFVINVMLLFVIPLQILRLCEIPFAWRPFLWTLAMLLWCYPMSRATMLCQIVPLMSVISWAAMLRLRAGQERGGAIALGIVGAAKLFPIVLLALPLFDRRWRFLIASLATGIAIYAVSLITLGLEVHGYWWEVMCEFGREVTPFFGNQSMMAWIARVVLDHSALEGRYVTDPNLAPFRYLLPLLFGGITLWLLWKLRGRLLREHLALSSGLVMSAVILSVPTAWEHYLLFVVPSVAWAVHETWRRRDSRLWELWLAAGVFLFLMKLTHFSYEPTLLSRIIAGSHSMGLLMLWVWFVRRVIRRSAFASDTSRAQTHEAVA